MSKKGKTKSLILPGHSVTASDFVDKHNPRVLKRTITEHSIDISDLKGFDSIRVICRFRPPNKRELAFSRKKDIPDTPPQWESEQCVKLQRPKNPQSHSKSSTKPFKCVLDSILEPNTTQKQVFYLVGQPMILSCLEGFNSTIFAYGQSGSGKTYTMFGPENDQSNVDQFGIIPRCFIYLFQKLNKSLSNNGGDLQDYKVNMELLQIYKRDLLDLLNPKSKVKLVIKTDFRTDSVFVQNLRSIEVNTVEEAFACLTEAQSNRIVAGHALNAVSSRSHMLVMVNIMQRSIDGSVKRSKLNFGDLAGSEDLTKALGKNPDPIRRQEAIAINSSLSALTTAMSFLSKGKKPGYRDSPLTHILKDSLGGNSKTIMFVACSPHIYNRNETIRALRFAATAKKVKNKAKKNEEQSTESLKKRIRELEVQVASLQAQLVETRGKKNVFKKAISKMVVDDFHGGPSLRQMSLRLSGNPYASLSNKKPGPIPHVHSPETRGSPVVGVMVPSTISEQLPAFRNSAQSMSLSVENMIKMQSANDHEEWSGSDDEQQEIVLSDAEELVDELLKDEGGEEELNYIHEISELRRQLEDALSENQSLNTQIKCRNYELEHCNNQIAQLVEEADKAKEETVLTKRKLSAENAYQREVPTYDSESGDSDNTPLPPIPPHVIDGNAPQTSLTLLPIASDASVLDHHQKLDSGFSFADGNGNNTMLKYLMDMQQNIQDATQDFQELKHTMVMNYRADDEFHSDFDSEEFESSEDTAAIADKEKQLDNALKKNLSKKRERSCFSCFMRDDSDEEKGVTSLLVEEYLKTHVRAEMKKQSHKMKKRKKRVREKRRKKAMDTQRSVDTSYNFDNDEYSVLTVSPTHTPIDHQSDFRLLSIQEDNRSDQSSSRRSNRSDKKYSLYVDALGDSTRDIQPKSKPRQKKTRV